MKSGVMRGQTPSRREAETSTQRPSSERSEIWAEWFSKRMSVMTLAFEPGKRRPVLRTRVSSTLQERVIGEKRRMGRTSIDVEVVHADTPVDVLVDSDPLATSRILLGRRCRRAHVVHSGRQDASLCGCHERKSVMQNEAAEHLLAEENHEVGTRTLTCNSVKGVASARSGSHSTLFDEPDEVLRNYRPVSEIALTDRLQDDRAHQLPQSSSSHRSLCAS